MKHDDFFSRHAQAFVIALAAIVVSLGLSSGAQAGIVYHATNIAIGSYNLDLNGDGVTDFILGWASHGNCFKTGRSSLALQETPSSGDGALVGPLKSGALIGPNQVFSEGAERLVTIYAVRDGIYCRLAGESGAWVPVSPKTETTGFLGFSFQLDGQTYYGWAKLSVRRLGLQTTLLGYAYETTPGMPISAGETDVKFTPSSLNFGTVTMGNTVSGSLTLTNLGATDLAITSATLSGTHAADFASDDTNPPCGGSVAVGGTCTLKFSFTPSISGTERATYSLFDSSGGSPQKLTLTGTGQ